MHTENIKKVQKETVKIITETEKLIDTLIEKKNKIKSEDKKARTSPAKLKADKDELHNEKLKLNNLEYVVAVVGTMKAGKSMTINAIVGQEILPSREFPMTTLPTLITHKPKQEKPILTLKNIKPFEELLNDIKSKLNTSKTSEQKDLIALIEKIKSDQISFEKTYEGSEEIEKFLKQLNDLMRIAKDFDIQSPYEDFTNIDELPRIEVEFYHLAKKENNSNAKLTLLDTPGPDEFKHSVILKEIFKNQLQRASAVMLLVDYTKMNSQSDAEVKIQVKNVADMLGEEHLFVLVNKFDQRKRSDNVEEKKEETKRLIAEDILKDKINKDNIYPVSAKSAFYANFGLRELDKNGKIDKTLKWIDDFGVTLMGEDWEDDIDDIKRVQKKCVRTWEKSYFEEPLKNIISTIHNDALFLSLKSPLDKLENLLREYSNVFKTRKSSYPENLENLAKTIESLKKDTKEVENINKEVTIDIGRCFEDIKSKIDEESKSIIKEIENNIILELNSNQKNKREEQKKEEKQRRNAGHHIDNNSFLHRELWPGGMFDFFKKTEKEDITSSTDFEKLKKEGKLEYRSPTKAKEVIEEISELFLNIAENSFKILEQNTNKNIDDLSNIINNNIKEKLGTLLDTIAEKFNNKGDKIEIDLPKININFDTKSNYLLSETSIKKEKDGYYKKIKDGFLNKFLHWCYSDWGVEKKEKFSYILKKDDILSDIKNILEKIQKDKMNKIDEIFDETIKKPIEEKLTDLINEIEGYRAEQIDVLNQKEKEGKKDIDDAIIQNNKYMGKVETLQERRSQAEKKLQER